MSKIYAVFTGSILFIVLIALSGCSSYDSATGSYQSTKKYKKALFSKIDKNSMAYEGVARNPVIVIHGFLGSRLENTKTKENVWGNFKGKELLKGYSNVLLKDMSIPMEQGKPLVELEGDVKPVDMLQTFTIVTLVGGKIQLHGYDSLLGILNEAGYVQDSKPLPENKNFYSLFPFHYDWRKSLDYNAAKLEKFIQKKRAYIQKKYKELYGIDNFDVQFDIVAHSMGGLLSRYYLRYGDQQLPQDGSMPIFDWRGSKNIDKVVIVGTPNAGYLDTIVQLVNGLKIDPHPIVPVYPPAVIGTFPGIYEMMPLIYTKSVVYADDPEGKAVDLFDPQVWIDMKWGLADPKQDKVLKILLPNIKTPEERRKIALNHLTKVLKNAKQFTDAMKLHSKKPEDVALYLFLGDSVETRRTAEADKSNGKLKVTEFEAGDGVVLTSSARMDEREGQKWEPFLISPINWDAVIHLKAAHMGITESDSFKENVIYYLLIAPTEKQNARKGHLKSLMKKIETHSSMN